MVGSGRTARGQPPFAHRLAHGHMVDLDSIVNLVSAFQAVFHARMHKGTVSGFHHGSAVVLFVLGVVIVQPTYLNLPWCNACLHMSRASAGVQRMLF
eukprot:726024-Prymnesium_polylepis.1